jgi:hypothetical protein
VATDWATRADRIHALGPGLEDTALGQPLLGSHAHKLSGARSQMTHLWLTRGLRSALANCLPVQALQIAIPSFRYEERTRASGSGPETRPCRPQWARQWIPFVEEWRVLARRLGQPTILNWRLAPSCASPIGRALRVSRAGDA